MRIKRSYSHTPKWMSFFGRQGIAYPLILLPNGLCLILVFLFYCSARPVYLQERYNGGTGTSWSSLNKSDSPPERPPKKPHLRGSADSATPPITPPRGATPSSRPPSRSSNATPPSRGTTPNSSIRGRPKFPSPPGSPEKSRAKEMTPFRKIQTAPSM